MLGDRAWLMQWLVLRLANNGTCHGGQLFNRLTCRAAPMDQAYISRTQPSLSFVSLSSSMCFVSRSQSGVICRIATGYQIAVGRRCTSYVGLFKMH